MATKDEFCSVSGLDLWDRPSRQAVIKSSQYVPYRPLSDVKTSRTHKVIYQGRPGVTIDLARTMYTMECKITKRDGTALTRLPGATPEAGERDPLISTINYIGATAFSEITLDVQNKTIGSTNNNYAHRAMLEVKTSYGKASKETWLKAQGYSEPTLPIPPKTSAEVRDPGFDWRRKMFRLSQAATFAGQLHLDFFNQPRHLVPNVNMQLTFTQASNETVVLYATDETGEYNFTITDLIVYFLENTLTDAESMRIETMLLKSPALYPINRMEIRTFSISQGATAYNEDNAFVGQLPHRILIAMTNDDEYTGSYTKSPFNYLNKNMNYIQLNVGGRQIPSQPMTPRIAKETIASGYDEYMWFIAGLGKLYDNEEVGIDPEQWVTLNRIYAFNMEAHMPPDCIGPREQGNVKINMRFAAPMSTATTLIVLAEFNNTIIIDHNRAVIHDF
jgi:hypothetical protein